MYFLIVLRKRLLCNRLFLRSVAFSISIELVTKPVSASEVHLNVENSEVRHLPCLFAGSTMLHRNFSFSVSYEIENYKNSCYISLLFLFTNTIATSGQCHIIYIDFIKCSSVFEFIILRVTMIYGTGSV